jgi:hypothetical protein
VSRPSVVLKFRPGRKEVCSEEILEHKSSGFHHVSHVSFIPPLVSKIYVSCTKFVILGHLQFNCDNYRVYI